MKKILLVIVLCVGMLSGCGNKEYVDINSIPMVEKAGYDRLTYGEDLTNKSVIIDGKITVFSSHYIDDPNEYWIEYENPVIGTCTLMMYVDDDFVNKDELDYLVDNFEDHPATVKGTFKDIDGSEYLVIEEIEWK